MQISVSGKNMDTGAAFQTHAQDALNGVVNKYFDRAVSGHVTLEKADAGFRVKTRVALSRRIELEATGYAHNAHAALDAAIEVLASDAGSVAMTDLAGALAQMGFEWGDGDGS